MFYLFLAPRSLGELSISFSSVKEFGSIGTFRLPQQLWISVSTLKKDNFLGFGPYFENLQEDYFCFWPNL